MNSHGVGARFLLPGPQMPNFQLGGLKGLTLERYIYVNININ